MSFRNIGTIDIVVKSPARENGVDLIIVESRDEDYDETERYQLLLQKLSTYVNFVLDKEFSRKWPHTEFTDVLIRVLYQKPPTVQMTGILNVGPKGDRANRLKVMFHDYKEFSENLDFGSGA